jgi:hypothetical protein
MRMVGINNANGKAIVPWGISVIYLPTHPPPSLSLSLSLTRSRTTSIYSSVSEANKEPKIQRYALVST